MLIDWLRLVPALVFLLTPIAVFHDKHVRYRALMRDWEGYWRRTLSLGLHTIDLLRALLGVWLLTEAVRRVPEAQGLMRFGAYFVHGAVLCVATVVQAVVCKEPEAAHAPFAFVVGLWGKIFRKIFPPIKFFLRNSYFFCESLWYIPHPAVPARTIVESGTKAKDSTQI